MKSKICPQRSNKTGESNCVIADISAEIQLNGYNTSNRDNGIIPAVIPVMIPAMKKQYEYI